jgi:DEAD/DEAH box helicase domain-containing protein
LISSTITVNRLIQRIGRAARKGQRGYAFLALGNDPISQYYKNHPDDYFEDVEKTYIDQKNPFLEELKVLAIEC